MKMIRAIIRTERVEEVAAELAKVHPALTKLHVFGRGKGGGLRIGEVVYDELPKVMLLIVVNDQDKEGVIETIIRTARTGKVGDGKIFISEVEEAYTIRTGERGV